MNNDIQPIRYGSVCSGIESASIAWEELGWQPAWFAEIEPFPSAVLAHHWPHVTNLGDMTQIADRILAREIEAPDVLVGGTPCQAFSVAGARKGLEDERGQLTISFGELADAIDTRRAEQGKPPCIVVWENVPGVLSSKDNAFGAFLGLLAGEDCELQPPGKRWETAGCVLRGKRAIAWRVLDAQYFGLAQRRKRVFVVASSREGFDPTAVLFESDCVRRDTPPSREKGQETSHDVGTGFTASSFGQYRQGSGTLRANGGDLGGGSETLVAQPYEPVSKCLNGGGMGRQDYETESFVCVPIHDKTTRHAGASGKGSGNGFGVGSPTDPCHTLTTGDNAVAAYGFQPRIGRNGRGDMGDVCHALSAEAGSTGKGDASPCVAVHGTQDPIVGNELAHALGRNNGGENVITTYPILEVGKRTGVSTTDKRAGLGVGSTNDPMFTLQAGAQHGVASVDQTPDTGEGEPCVAFSAKDYGADASKDLSPTLRAGTHDKSHANSGSWMAVASFAPAEVGPTMGASGPPYSRPGNERVETETLAITNMSVRRLTPIECERLQGFPDGHTLIPSMARKKIEDDYRQYLIEFLNQIGAVVSDDELERMAKDGPRYKAIGNSKAVLVVRWLGRRIDAALGLLAR